MCIYLVFAWLGATNAVIKVAAGPVEVEDEDQITPFEHDYSVSFVFSWYELMLWSHKLLTCKKSD